MVGSRAPAAGMLMSIRLLFTSASAQIYAAWMWPLTASNAGAISRACRMSIVVILQTECLRCNLYLIPLPNGGGIGNIGQDRQPTETGHELPQQFEAL